MPVSSVDAFLDLLTRSSLLSPRRLERARGIAATHGEPRELANALIQNRWLTTWQALQLLNGSCQFTFGNYILLKVRGKGRMGTVFKALEPERRRVVALKIMSPHLLSEPRAVARFQREIRSVAALDHPNIVRSRDAGRVGDVYFLAMQYVSGQDLQEWSRAVKEFPVDWACECIRQAALGLQHAFERGVVHRDIKPSNLIVVGKTFPQQPAVKILDMGLVRFERETRQDGGLTRDGYTVGTIDYMAPEQIKSGRDADIRADIFSLGCTLYELVTRRSPFPGNSLLEMLMAREKDDPIPMSHLRAGVPPALDAVVARMIAKDRNRRHQTPAEVVAALAPFVQGGAALLKRRPTAGTKHGPPPEKHPQPANTAEGLLPRFRRWLRKQWSARRVRRGPGD